MILDKLSFCAFLLVVWVSGEDEIQVEIPQGKLKGLKATSVLQKKAYYSFKGIPYAKPNTGPDKFKTPEPGDPWQGVWDATSHRSSCPFFCMIRQGLIGDEDCLHLNVYTPELKEDAKLPVMVWFHGGGFNAGSGEDDVYGPDFLIEQDVILVTINHRLGAIGFLNTGDDNAPGNAGMKDQVMALKWIRDNIKHFGGCPNRVTLFGQSSGAASVQYHMISPMSQGLFKGAILESGSVMNPWASSQQTKELAFKLGEVLGVTTTDTTELVNKLKNFSPNELVTASQEVSKTMNIQNGHMWAFVPTVEADLGKERFLPDNPIELLKSGTVADVPVLAGVVKEETSLFLPMSLEHLDVLATHFENFLPCNLNVTDAAMKKQLGDSLKSFYFKNKELTKDTAEELRQMMDDIYFVSGVKLSLGILGKRNSAPIYEYLFTYEAPFGVMKNLFKIEKGVAHGDELGYEFYSNAFKNIPTAGSPAEKMTKMFTKMLTNFAKDGNPTSNKDDLVQIDWQPMGKDDNYLNINQELKMEKGLFKDRMEFFMGLYKTVLGN